MAKHRIQMVVSFILALTVCACSGGNVSSSGIPRISNALPTTVRHVASTDVRRTANVLQNGVSYIAIDAGGGAPSGEWVADEYNYGGLSANSTNAVDTSQVSNPAPQSVYQSQRWGSAFAYVIPNLTPGHLYSIRLHFVDQFFTTAGKRVFNVAINGSTVLKHFDIVGSSGGSNIAIEKEASATPGPNGKIQISFTSIVNCASVAGIELTDTQSITSPSPAPSSAISIDSGGAALDGWLADNYYNSGWISSVSNAIDTSKVSDPAPQSIYQTQRVSANLSYDIPGLIPSGKYTVRLQFAETFFNKSGQRVFNVDVNGVRVLTNYDIFQVAGGANIALAATAPTQASASGVIKIEFAASVNNASVAGIQIIGGTATSSPQPTPSTTASAVPEPSPTMGQYPIYSSYYTGNTPFHHTVTDLIAAGATVLSPTISKNYWAEGIGNGKPANQGGGVGPLYIAAEGQPAYTFSCPTYGKCNASGMVVHYPQGAYPETGTDHHLNTFDPVFLHGEIDGWGGDGNPNHACKLTSGSPGTAACSWGGFYPFGGTGLASGGNSGDAGGYAYGLMDITAQELLQGHIDHALGIEESCLDDGGVYPSTVGRSSDAHCPASQEPNAKYGDLVHLKSTVNVGALGYSHYCEVIVQALQTYGAYTADNNGQWGLSLNFEYMNAYSGTNPWYSTIFPDMVSGGDGSGASTTFSFQGCLQRIPASDIEILQISASS